MDFEAKARAVVEDMCLALNYNGESTEAAKDGAGEQVADILREVFEAGQNEAPTAEYLLKYSQAVVAEVHAENNRSRVYEFANLVNEARTGGGLVDCTGDTPTVRKVLGKFKVTDEGDVIADNGTCYGVANNWRDGMAVYTIQSFVDIGDTDHPAVYTEAVNAAKAMSEIKAAKEAALAAKEGHTDVRTK